MSDEMETQQQGRECISCAKVWRAVLLQFDSSCLGPVCLLGMYVRPGSEALRYLNEPLTQPEAKPQSAAPSLIRSNRFQQHFILVGNVGISRPHVRRSLFSNNPI